jgi:hypothetical protein
MIASLAALLLSSLASVALASLPAYAAKPGFALRFEDDFAGPFLDTTYWTALDGYVQTQYDLVCYMADDVSVADSNLVIRTRVNTQTCITGGFNPALTTTTYGYTSGFVDTVGKLSVRNGRIEINAKLPEPTFRVSTRGARRAARGARRAARARVSASNNQTDNTRPPRSPAPTLCRSGRPAGQSLRKTSATRANAGR